MQDLVQNLIIVAKIDGFAVTTEDAFLMFVFMVKMLEGAHSRYKPSLSSVRRYPDKVQARS